MIWFTSDLHFNHSGVIRYCNRPFGGRREMDEYLIAQWNKRVKPNETVYVLGDFSFAGTKYTKEVIKRLNGIKYLVLGNHDKDAKAMLDMGFDKVYENIDLILNPGKIRVFLSHFPYHPMTQYGKYPSGETYIGYPENYKVDTRYLHKRIIDDGKTWLLCGHVHTAWKQYGRQINVGVDQWDYAPISHEKILQIIAQGPKIEGMRDNTADGD